MNGAHIPQAHRATNDSNGRFQPVRFASSLCILGVLSQVAGCVTSERSGYERHLEARVAAGAASDDDLAFTFGLDAYATAPLASAPADDQ